MKVLTRVVILYSFLLLGLAILGVKSQALYRELNGSRKTLGLLEQKHEYLKSLTDLRHQAEQIKGPLAIRAWAKNHGMVPINQLNKVQMVAPLTAPEFKTIKPGKLKVYTIWR